MKKLAKLLAVVVCLTALVALAACSSPTVSRSSESFDVKSEAASSASSSAASSDTEPFYALVIGNDTRIGTVEQDDEDYSDGRARSDTIMLVRVDPKTYRIGIVTIPRDTAAPINNHMAKINETYKYLGAQGLIDQVTALAGVTPKYYLDMTFVQYEDFINQLGGIKAYVPANIELQDIVGGDEITLSEGEQELNGAQALVLARSRKQYSAPQDARRQINDRALVEAGIMMIANNPDKAESAVDTLFANCDSNWPKDKLLALVKDFSAHADQITFQKGTGPYDGENDPETGDWLATRDENAWHQIIEVLEAGGDPTTVVPLP